MTSAGELISKLDFLDTETALVYFGNLQDLYAETVSMYVRDRYDAELQRLYEAEDWPSYQRVAHSIKSTSNMIGSADMFEKAKSLEMAVKANDIDFIRANHDPVMKDYKELLSKIEAALA